MMPKPKVSARYLADFMAASARGERTILQGCKFRPIARLVQHDKAKSIVGAYIRSGKIEPQILAGKAQDLHDLMASDDFDREVLDHNADYVQRFADVASSLVLPPADASIPGACPPLTIHGTVVTVDLCVRLRRLTKTNKVRVGAGTLRYVKGKALPPEVGAWQSAFLFGYLRQDSREENAEPEYKLCLTIDAYAGTAYAAPTNSVQRFKNMQAACATIAERWDNIPPPPGAIF